MTFTSDRTVHLHAMVHLHLPTPVVGGAAADLRPVHVVVIILHPPGTYHWPGQKTTIISPLLPMFLHFPTHLWCLVPAASSSATSADAASS